MARKNRPRKRTTKKKTRARSPLNQKGTRFVAPKEFYYQKIQWAELENAGWKVFNTSEARARTTMSPGIPDLLAFHPEEGILLFIEAKRPTAVGPNDEEIWANPPQHYLSEEQREFRDLVATVKKVHHIVGAREALMSYLGMKKE